MKRKELITKLVKEGMTEKTLAVMSDKQLNQLYKRLIPEQITSTIPTLTTTSSGIKKPDVNISLKDPKLPEKAKKLSQIGMGFAATESELKEQPLSGSNAKKQKKEEDKKTIVDRLHNKIQHCIKSGKKYDDYIRLAKEINNGELPEKISGLVGKKKKVKEEKTLTKSKAIQEWVNNVVEKNHHPFTSKGEILGLIENKLTEQRMPWETDDDDEDVMTMDPEKEPLMSPDGPDYNPEPPKAEFDDVLSYDVLKQLAGRDELVSGLGDYIKSLGIGSPQTQPETEPEIIPTTDPDTQPDIEPYHPLHPGPGIDPNPKAGIGQPQTRPETEPDVIPTTEPDIDPDEEPYHPLHPGPGIDPNPKAKRNLNIR